MAYDKGTTGFATFHIRIARFCLSLDLPQKWSECLDGSIFAPFIFDSAGQCKLYKLVFHIIDPNSLPSPPKADIPGDGPIESFPILHLSSIQDTFDKRTSQAACRLRPHTLAIYEPSTRTMETFGFPPATPLTRLRFHGVQAFCGLFAEDDGLLVHGAGFVLDGHGGLLLGPSGAGKSTAVELLKADRLLSDDAIAVTDASGDAMVHATPLGNTTDGPASAPLRAVFFLRQGSEFKLERLGVHDAINRFTNGQADLLCSMLKPHVGLTFKNAHRLFQKVPTYLMTFERDRINKEAIMEVLRQS